MYPIIVLLLVDQKCSLGATTYISSGSVLDITASRRSRLEPMTFVPGRVSANNQTAVDNTKPRSGMHFSLLSTTEPDDVERDSTEQ